MKTTIAVRVAAVALMSSAPLFAYAGSDDSVQRCTKVFADQHFADTKTTFKSEPSRIANRAMPLKSTRHVRVVANDPETGKVVATGFCTVQNGIAMIGNVTTTDKVATR